MTNYKENFEAILNKCMVALPDEIPSGVSLKKVKPCLCTIYKTFSKISLVYVLLEGTFSSYQPILLIRLPERP